MINPGETIRKIREEYNLTEGRFARAIGVETFKVINWENNVNIPTLEVMDRIVNTFGYKITLSPIESKNSSKNKSAQIINFPRNK